MKHVTLLVFWSAFITYAKAQACLPEGGTIVGTIYVNNAIDDDASGEVAQLKVPNIISASGFSEYLEISGPEDGIITVSLTDEFDDFEEDNPSMIAGNSIHMQILLMCSTGSTQMTFTQPINDINNHEPEFSRDEYKYKLPMPFVPIIEISQFGSEIVATDIDITNTLVNFEIDSDLFTLNYEGTIDSLYKDHKVGLFPKQPMEFTTTYSFTITATDVGNPTLSSTATLTIEVDEENSLKATPIFSSVYYEVEYIVSSNSLHTAEAAIPVANAEFAVFDIDEDYRNNFELTYESGVLNIRLITNFEEDDLEEGGFIPIEITATISDFRYAKTALIVSLPGEVTSPSECSVGSPGNQNMIGNVFVNPAIRNDVSGAVAVLTVPKIISVIGSGSDYLKVSVLDDNQVQVSLTDEFQNYDASSGELNLQLQIVMTCRNKINVLVFVQPVVDTGIVISTAPTRSIPKLDRSEYVYRLQMPFPCGMNITQFGPEIITTNIDSLSDDIIFDIDSNYFSFSYENIGNAQNKTYRGILTSVKRLNFAKTQEFTLTVTDPKLPNQSITARIIIEVYKRKNWPFLNKG